MDANQQKRRPQPSSALAIALICALVGAASLAEEPPDTLPECESAGAMLALGLTAEARKLLVEAIKADSTRANKACFKEAVERVLGKGQDKAKSSLVADPPECRSANTMLALGLTAEARKLLVEAIKADSTKANKACFKEAVERVLDKKQDKARGSHVGQARALADAGDFSAALKKLQEAPPDVGADPLIRQQMRAYATAATEAEFKRARTLAAIGMQDKAITVLEETVEAHPETRIPPDLEYLGEDTIKSWRLTKQWFKAEVIPAAEILLTVLVTLWLLVLLMRLVVRVVGRPSLTIEDFAEPRSTKLGAAVSALVKAAYQGFTQGQAGHTTRISGNIQGLSLPTAVETNLPNWLATATIKTILAFTDQLVPGRRITLSGQLLNSEARGAGIALRLDSRKRQLAGITLWEMDFRGEGKTLRNKEAKENADDAGDFEHLAEYAAIWLLFHLSRGYGLFGPHWIHFWQHWRLRAAMGTVSWRAYVLFRAGYHAEQRGDDEEAKEARDLYVEAIRQDSGFEPPKINLGNLGLRRKDDVVGRRIARALWTECLESKGSINAIWRGGARVQAYYVANYNLAVLSYEEGEAKQALELSRKLDTSLKCEREWLCRPYRNRFGWGNEFHDYLHVLALYNKAALAALYYETGDTEKGSEIIEKELKADEPIPRVQYNLACAHSMLAAKQATAQAQPANGCADSLEKSIEHLENSLWLDARVAKYARENDRSLAFVAKKHEARFKSIVDSPPDPSPPKPAKRNTMTVLDSVDDSLGAKLAEMNIDTVSDLLFAAISAQQREDLAAKLEIGREQVLEWALAMDLASIRGLELKDLNLLIGAGLGSIEALKAAAGRPLAETIDRLEDWAKTRKMDLPEQWRVKVWLEEAAQKSPYVQP